MLLFIQVSQYLENSELSKWSISRKFWLEFCLEFFEASKTLSIRKFGCHISCSSKFDIQYNRLLETSDPSNHSINRGLRKWPLILIYDDFFSNNNHFILVFDVTIILTILINCVFLALDDPLWALGYRNILDFWSLPISLMSLSISLITRVYYMPACHYGFQYNSLYLLNISFIL